MLEKVYDGSKVYVGIQIPDADSASRRNIDLILVTNHEAVVITVKSLPGFVSTDKDGNWLCPDGKHKKSRRYDAYLLGALGAKYCSSILLMSENTKKAGGFE
ncbi:hypothetical protein CASFOL_035347 [Castilleja foliolosa]|uniref:NERD domain-containing protein n=1 Tax=Castilleja foliolosa TaxID=1961234 RepID=A0ABD3BSK5_9LAMI